MKAHTQGRRAGFGAAVSACMVLAAACTPSTDFVQTKTPSMSVQPIASPEAVEVLSALPNRPYEEIGMLTVAQGLSWSGSVDTLIPALRDEAASHGCSAIVVGHTTSVASSVGYTATCLVYTGAAPPSPTGDEVTQTPAVGPAEAYAGLKQVTGMSFGMTPALARGKCVGSGFEWAPADGGFSCSGVPVGSRRAVPMRLAFSGDQLREVAMVLRATASGTGADLIEGFKAMRDKLTSQYGSASEDRFDVEASCATGEALAACLSKPGALARVRWDSSPAGAVELGLVTNGSARQVELLLFYRAARPAAPAVAAKAVESASVPGAAASTAGGPPDSHASGPATARTCAPGQSVACTGKKGCQGYQVCATDGSRFDPCICD